MIVALGLILAAGGVGLWRWLVPPRSSNLVLGKRQQALAIIGVIRKCGNSKTGGQIHMVTGFR